MRSLLGLPRPEAGWGGGLVLVVGYVPHVGTVLVFRSPLRPCGGHFSVRRHLGARYLNAFTDFGA